MVNVLLTQDFNYNFYFYSGDGITNLSKFKLQPDQVVSTNLPLLILFHIIVELRGL